jgi:electron transfer flavoprotein alpha subunit
MTVLVYFKANLGLSKVATEIVTYAKKIGEKVVVLTNGDADANVLSEYGKYGASKVLWDADTNTTDNQVLSRIIGTTAEKEGAKAIISG